MAASFSGPDGIRGRSPSQAGYRRKRRRNGKGRHRGHRTGCHGSDAGSEHGSKQVPGGRLRPGRGKVAKSGQRSEQRIAGCPDLATFVALLEVPRRILMMVPAGEPVDAVIDGVKSSSTLMTCSSTAATRTLRRQSGVRASWAAGDSFPRDRRRGGVWCTLKLRSPGGQPGSLGAL